jgi:hypothetical protein
MTRPPGRPPIADKDESIPVTVRVSSTQYDKMFAAAERDRVSIAEWIRRRTRAESENSERSK